MRLVLAAASLAIACSGAPLPRETTADNARIDDLWLDGERCSAGSHESDDAAMHVEEIAVGTGTPAFDGETVRVHYVARLPDGALLHDTRAEGPPVEIIIGSTKIICGFERALLGMRPGGQRRVTVPWRLAFGEAGRPPEVRSRTDVVFVIDLFVPADRSQQLGGAPSKPPASRGGGGGRGPGGH